VRARPNDASLRNWAHCLVSRPPLHPGEWPQRCAACNVGQLPAARRPSCGSEAPPPPPRPPARSRHCLLKSYLQSRCSRAPTKALQSCKLKSGVMCHQRWRCGAAAAGCNLSNAAASKAGSARHGMCRCIRNTKLKSPALPSSQAGLIEGPRHPGHTPLTAPGAAYCWTAAWRCTAESRRCPPAPAPAVFCAGGGRRGRGSRHSRNLGPPT
jgi:hypothetical protein